MTDSETFVQRYVAMWNERDPERRHHAASELFAEDGVDYTGTRELHGLDEIKSRVDAAHDKYVAEQGYFFRLLKADGHHNAVRLSWEMVADGGEPASIGFDFLILDGRGRILFDYQFVDR